MGRRILPSAVLESVDAVTRDSETECPPLWEMITSSALTSAFPVLDPFGLPAITALRNASRSRGVDSPSLWVYADFKYQTYTRACTK